MELPASIEECHTLLISQGQVMEELMARIMELERGLNQNSDNSHKPPCSDGLSKKPAFPRDKSGKRGRQWGHKGDTLKMSSSVDHIHECAASACSCGADLSATNWQIKQARQVFDLADPKLQISEYRLMGCKCPSCGKQVKGEFPDSVTGPVQYGQGVKALVGLLSSGYHLSYQGIEQLFSDLFGYALNENTMLQAHGQCYSALESSYQQSPARE